MPFICVCHLSYGDLILKDLKVTVQLVHCIYNDLLQSFTERISIHDIQDFEALIQNIGHIVEYVEMLSFVYRLSECIQHALCVAS